MGVITDRDITICGHGSGTPSIKNLQTYSSSRYSQVASNGVHKGIVAVRRYKGLTAAKRNKLHDTYKTILGRNHYSQNLRGYVYKPYKNGLYYSDCSSSGMATFEKVGLDIGDWYLNTAGIYYTDELFEDVPVKIEKGHITNPEVLEVFDAILFAGNDPSRPKQIGHVEWVYTVPEKTTKKESKTKKAYTGVFPVLPDRGYFKKGDKGAEVKLLQKLLNWINDDKISVDGDFGTVTQTAVKRSQKILGVKNSGKFGKQTLAAAKKLKK